MHDDLGEGFELSYSVQIDSTRLLELMVDECDTGNSVWQIVDGSGEVMERSDAYADQALCLRDGLNRALPPTLAAGADHSPRSRETARD